MRLAVLSDIHDNVTRLEEALTICRHEKIEICICCGDLGQLETLTKLAEDFRHVYLALGNADYGLLNKTGLFPDNVTWSEDVLIEEIEGKRIAVAHHDHEAKDLAQLEKFDVVFYGHTHTPWEKMVGKTILLNPGEVSGQFGQASFAIFDTDIMKAELKLLK